MGLFLQKPSNNLASSVTVNCQCANNLVINLESFLKRFSAEISPIKYRFLGSLDVEKTGAIH
jgi:hypothetical protein